MTIQVDVDFSGFRCRCWFNHSLVDFDTSFTKEHAATLVRVTETGYADRQYKDNSITLKMEATCSSETCQLILLHSVKTQTIIG